MWRKDHPENISTGWKASEKWRETKWGFANTAVFTIFIEIIKYLSYNKNINLLLPISSPALADKGGKQKLSQTIFVSLKISAIWNTSNESKVQVKCLGWTCTLSKAQPQYLCINLKQ